jgi:hypothetical protein
MAHDAWHLLDSVPDLGPLRENDAGREVSSTAGARQVETSEPVMATLSGAVVMSSVGAERRRISASRRLDERESRIIPFAAAGTAMPVPRVAAETSVVTSGADTSVGLATHDGVPAPQPAPGTVALASGSPFPDAGTAAMRGPVVEGARHTLPDPMPPDSRRPPSDIALAFSGGGIRSSALYVLLLAYEDERAGRL